MGHRVEGNGRDPTDVATSRERETGRENRRETQRRREGREESEEE